MLKFKLLSKSEAKSYIAKPDVYLNSLTPYYIKSILKKSDQYDSFVKNFQNSCFDFNANSHEEIKEYEILFNHRLKQLNIDIDKTIFLILTDGSDNIRLPYTKGEAIIIPNKRFSLFNNGSSQLLSYALIAHETFHALSRNNTNLRKDCYKSLGWKDAGHNLFPEHILKDVFINPDAVSHDHYIEFTDRYNRAHNIAPIMYKGMGQNFFGVFDENLQFEKLQHFNEFYGYNYLWKNTSYNNHPEELSAEHFMLLISKDQENYSDTFIMKKFYRALINNFGI